MRTSILLFFCLSVLLVGCSRATTDSVISKDGSWTRTVKLTVQKMPGDPESNSFADTFGTPLGSDWKSKVEFKGEDRTTTFSRKVATGNEVLTDVIVREKGQTTYKNFVTIRSLGGNKYEYLEKFVATQVKPSETEAAIVKLVEVLNAQLPPDLLSKQEVQKVSRECFRSLIASIFGPDEHLIGVMLLSGAGGEKRLKARFYETLDRSLSGALGDRLSSEKRQQLIVRVTQTLDEDTLLGKQKKSAKEGDSNGMVGLSSSVSFPGKLIETNGRIFPLTGEVYWDYSTLSADFEPIELRAVFQL